MWLAARALRPVEALTAAAERVTARGLDQRLFLSGNDREFQRLAAVFNAMLDRLEKSFHQATRFSADASHELKTPLALLQAELEQALKASKANDRTTVIVIDTDPMASTDAGGAWWDVGVPEISTRPQVVEAHKKHEQSRSKQRLGN